MDHPRPLRSCSLCRQRKIKCGRQQPCSNCVRLESHCVYPAGYGRAPKRPRKAFEARLLAQLSQLEMAVKCMEGQSTDAGSNTASQDSSPGHNPEMHQQFGRLVIDDMQSCYVSSAPWAQLGDEIEELRDLLHHPASDDEDAQSVSTLHGPGSNGAILGYRALAHSLHAYHPPISQAVLLFDIFRQNVSPLIRIFHTSTLDRLFWDAIASMDSLDKNIEALLFAIYYAAVISLDPEECISMFGIPRIALLETYRFATEQATARADLLNTQNFILLQATVVFLTALRNEDDSRTVWRLWWHICLLDNRSTDYHGSEPIMHEHVFDTKMPLNINDTDISADMTQPPPERDEATEMTLCLIRCHSMRVIWKVGYKPRQQKPESESTDNGPDSLDRDALASELEHRLQEKFLRHCDATIPFFRLVLMVARVITRRMWMAVLCARSLNSPEIRNRLFADSIEVLELSNKLLTEKDTKKWAWHSKTHIQWYSVAFLLAELCRRPPSMECDHAWDCVNAVYERWNIMESEKRGTLWRPIRRLMARARYVREVQKAQKRTTAASGVATGQVWGAAGESGAPSQNTQGMGITDTAVLESQAQAQNSAPEYNPLMEIPPVNATGLLDASVMDIFGFFSETSEFPGYIPDMGTLPV
ncbi:Zn(II)2Cys6 transcription factor [Aspergillus undulatus]|uniref:Zn(II)2Cys6 transcription factor n=1 Tax=Aspergillus undulatus TaxID=1810928 RepID=UPI003CCD1484